MLPMQVVALDDLGELEPLAMPTPHFLVLLALAVPGVPADAITDVAGALMTRGAVAFACVGPDADRVEGAIDGVAIRRYDPLASDAASKVIWTTSHQHARDGLTDALDFLSIAAPAPAYATTCGAILAIVVGSERWARQLAVSSSR